MIINQISSEHELDEESINGIASSVSNGSDLYQEIKNMLGQDVDNVDKDRTMHQNPSEECVPLDLVNEMSNSPEQPQDTQAIMNQAGIDPALLEQIMSQI